MGAAAGTASCPETGEGIAACEPGGAACTRAPGFDVPAPSLPVEPAGAGIDTVASTDGSVALEPMAGGELVCVVGRAGSIVRGSTYPCS